MLQGSQNDNVTKTRQTKKVSHVLQTDFPTISHRLAIRKAITKASEAAGRSPRTPVWFHKSARYDRSSAPGNYDHRKMRKRNTAQQSLIHKMSNLLPSNMCQILELHLSGRTFLVSHKDEKSAFCPILAGVP